MNEAAVEGREPEGKIEASCLQMRLRRLDTCFLRSRKLDTFLLHSRKPTYCLRMNLNQIDFWVGEEKDSRKTARHWDKSAFLIRRRSNQPGRGVASLVLCRTFSSA
jgi:hypothetical protein